MSEKSSQKRGLFGWFGGKKKATETQPEPQPEQQSEQQSAPLSEPQSDTQADTQPDTQIHPADEIGSIADSNEQLQTSVKQEQVAIVPSTESAQKQETKSETQSKPSFFQRLKSGLSKTRSQFSEGLANLVLGQKEIDEDILEEVETLLLLADVGVETTDRIIKDLSEKSNRKELKDTQALMQRLRELLLEVLQPVQAPLVIPQQDTPFVILMVGVNGVGKTTTIGKLAHQFIAQGKSVILAAGDTFRAAAVEQLKTWGERNQVPVIAQHTGADSASVIFDAVEAARARKVDIVIADTAGRLHNKSNLMEELSKVKRVMKKIDPGAPHEVMLVVDACTGQNALVQAVEFNKVIELDSVTITKLDGTAKGGVIFALADKMKLPIRYIGIGESKHDLRNFDAGDYIKALFEK